ncbi:Hypothetical predicted protein [Mytilus galloprovincialis]|uniref:SOWAHA-C winged helix-turn-helix domain-containing protein n=1 Tax=Mytilus galloprovincialis TaxID=29158 RepID=A0A8B6E649_MYTGA|nr:Hypothetical predicted protein [Mytilus galloprovincialis]
MASGFTEEIVKDFIIKNGCKVTNHELVTKFKTFLNDQEYKVQNREKFKDYVNTLATIKVDEKGEKVLVLKKRYRPDNENQTDRAMSEPPDKPSGDDFDGGGMSKVKSDGHLSVKDSNSETSSLRGSMDTLSASSLTSSTTSQNSSDPQQMSKSKEDVNDSVISVKDWAKRLNKIQSESELQLTSEPNLRRKDITRHTRDNKENDVDDDSHSSGGGYTSYTPEQKEWLVTCSSGEYHEIHRVLTKHPFIAKTRTALHWAAKHGKPEVCKLLLSRPGVETDTRSGYTALHLAAMHGHENIIELLVQTYKADSNIRDYSGKKAKQYLRNSASTKAQQLLLTRRLGSTSAAVSGRSLDDSFTRTASFRKSNRARALSSLILSKSSNMKNAMFRSTWTGSADNIEDYRSRSPSRTPPNASPSLSRRQSKANKKGGSKNVEKEYADKERMPPPSGLFRKSRKGSAVHSSKDSVHSDDGVFSSNTVTRSESEPSLQTPRSNNHTYV